MIAVRLRALDEQPLSKSPQPDQIPAPAYGGSDASNSGRLEKTSRLAQKVQEAAQGAWASFEDIPLPPAEPAGRSTQVPDAGLLSATCAASLLSLTPAFARAIHEFESKLSFVSENED